ncbi:MAG: hypothetical protein OEZ34_02880 [Spirochaetia bacterium]|nr:hypothetical protein [Spirochaetia bacterium]
MKALQYLKLQDLFKKLNTSSSIFYKQTGLIDPLIRTFFSKNSRIAFNILILSFFTIVIHPLQSERDFKIKPLKTGFFLLPPPVTDQSEVMLRLFTAPVVDGFLLEEKAEKYEKHSKMSLQKNYNVLQGILCSLNPEERKSAILYYEEQNRREFQIWKEIMVLYDKNIDFWLDSNLKESPYRSLLSEWKERYSTVSELRLERQTLVMKAWKRFFKSARKKKFCESDLKKSGPEITEKLYLPLYIALYRFFEPIPADYRNDLILTMNSGK